MNEISGQPVGDGIGHPARRKEDLRLLTGRGDFTSDRVLEGMAHAHILRSPYPHAEIRSIDLEPARAAPGVLAALAYDDYMADGENGGGELPHLPNSTDLLDPSRFSLYNTDGSELFVSGFPPLAPNRVRYVGETVAIVVAETRDQAKDAAELIQVDYAPLPAVADVRDAVAPDAPQLWDGCPGNVMMDMERGDRAAVDAAFEKAAHVVTLELINHRVAQVPMEPRVSVAAWEGDRLVLHGDTQGVFAYKMGLAKAFGMPPEKIRVITHDVGGGFGMRNFLYSEHLLISWAAKRLGRPVKWQGERAECMATDMGGRDFVTEGSLALDADGRFLALKIDHLYNVGAYTCSQVPVSNGQWTMAGCYKFDAALYHVRSVVTNTVHTGPYRGAGRPEAIHNIERLVDAAADVTGIDRIELRRRNLIRPEDLPMTTVTGLPMEAVDHPGNMEATLEAIDWDDFAARREASAMNGKRRGIGFAIYFETPTGAPKEWTNVVVDPKGEVRADMGVGPTGQGHETVFAQVLCERLGVPFDNTHILIGDSDRIVLGGGSHSVRSMRLGGEVIMRASDRIIEKGKEIASHMLEASPADIEFAAGTFTVGGTDRSVGIFEVAAAAESDRMPEDVRGPLEAVGEFDGRLRAYPCGCVAVEVEVDPDTGKVEIMRYVQTDDPGTVINPLLTHGQVHGGIAQGVGQALMEGNMYDRETAQLVAGTFMDYAMPRADDFCDFETSFRPIPAPSNPLGVKGAGEAGTTPAPAAMVNAVVDALKPLGVTHLHQPLTPERVWRAISEVKG